MIIAILNVILFNLILIYNRYENIKKMHLFLNKIKTEIK